MARPWHSTGRVGGFARPWPLSRAVNPETARSVRSGAIALRVVRMNECEAATHALGARAYYLHLPDPGPARSAKTVLARWGEEKIRERLVRVIRQVRPHVVLFSSAVPRVACGTREGRVPDGAARHRGSRGSVLLRRPSPGAALSLACSPDVRVVRCEPGHGHAGPGSARSASGCNDIRRARGTGPRAPPLSRPRGTAWIVAAKRGRLPAGSAATHRSARGSVHFRRLESAGLAGRSTGAEPARTGESRYEPGQPEKTAPRRPVPGPRGL